MKRTVVGMDLGTNMLCAAAANADRFGDIHVLGAERSVTSAVKDGAIVDADKATRDIRALLENLSKKIGRKIKYVYANINDSTIRGEISRGMIPIASRARVVTDSDIDKCKKVARIFNLPLDKELLHSVPQRFFIDDKIPVRDPKGLHATKLSVDMYMITANISSVQNILGCVDKAGFILKGLVFAGLAASCSVLQKKEKEKGVLLADVGKKIARISLFFDGVLEAVSVLPRAEENAALLEDIGKERAKLFSGSIRSVVLIGEGALSEGLIEESEKILKQPSRIGIARNISGELKDTGPIMHAPSIGIVKYIAEELGLKKERNYALSRIFKKIWDIADSYF